MIFFIYIFKINIVNFLQTLNFFNTLKVKQLREWTVFYYNVQIYHKFFRTFIAKSFFHIVEEKSQFTNVALVKSELFNRDAQITEIDERQTDAGQIRVFAFDVQALITSAQALAWGEVRRLRWAGILRSWRNVPRICNEAMSQNTQYQLYDDQHCSEKCRPKIVAIHTLILYV